MPGYRRTCRFGLLAVYACLAGHTTAAIGADGPTRAASQVVPVGRLDSAQNAAAASHSSRLSPEIVARLMMKDAEQWASLGWTEPALRLAVRAGDLPVRWLPNEESPASLIRKLNPAHPLAAKAEAELNPPEWDENRSDRLAGSPAKPDRTDQDAEQHPPDQAAAPPNSAAAPGAEHHTTQNDPIHAGHGPVPGPGPGPAVGRAGESPQDSPPLAERKTTGEGQPFNVTAASQGTAGLLSSLDGWIGLLIVAGGVVFVFLVGRERIRLPSVIRVELVSQPAGDRPVPSTASFPQAAPQTSRLPSTPPDSPTVAAAERPESELPDRPSEDFQHWQPQEPPQPKVEDDIVKRLVELNRQLVTSATLG